MADNWRTGVTRHIELERCKMPLDQLGHKLGPHSQPLLGMVFRLLRKIKPARERVVPGELPDLVEREHIARYEFAKSYCNGKTVADIACGSGYGSDILRQVAKKVDSYDKELLCDNFIIDLDKESWDKSYEVIVCFETIEHLRNPCFFLANAYHTAKLLIISTPLGEFKGYNPHHKQTWELPEFSAKLERWFDCTYYFQDGVSISAEAETPKRFVIAVAWPKKRSYII